MYWTTKNGKQIRVSEMTTSHIKNCLRMLERGHFDKDKYDGLVQELRNRDVPFLKSYIEDSEVIKPGMFDE